MLSNADILTFVRKVIQFPQGQICKHLIAADLLDLLERNGYDLAQDAEMVSAVVGADDEAAVRLLTERIEGLKNEDQRIIHAGK